MNPILTTYFQAVEVRLIHSPVILSYQRLRREIGLIDGKFRYKLELIDNSLVECFAYVSEASGQLQTLKYSFHWQDKTGKLMQRWDNAPHYPNLPNSPHHIHKHDGSVIQAINNPDIMDFLDFLESELTQ